MKRIRKNGDGSETVFVPVEFDTMGPYRAEIAVASLDELREATESARGDSNTPDPKLQLWLCNHRGRDVSKRSVKKKISVQ